MIAYIELQITSNKIFYYAPVTEYSMTANTNNKLLIVERQEFHVTFYLISLHRFS